jgi:hypothetical protein
MQFIGETIPIRLFLGGFDLTPTFRDVNKKFSVRYYLNLVLIDEENRRYFKQQEITVFRIPEVRYFLGPTAKYQTTNELIELRRTIWPSGSCTFIINFIALCIVEPWCPQVLALTLQNRKTCPYHLAITRVLERAKSLSKRQDTRQSFLTITSDRNLYLLLVHLNRWARSI